MTGLARNVVAEALGTLLFVFAIITAVNSAGDFAPLAIGLALMVLVYATGHISGGHLNPAVSIAAWLRGAIGAGDFIAYIIAQFIGGVLGALLSFAVFPSAAAAVEIDIWPAFLVELVFTFVLAYVVLNVATAKSNDGNSFYGLAIGGTVVVGAFAVGAVSGGGFNPAVALGLSVSGQFAWGNLWLYILAPLIGGVLAALAFRLLNPQEYAKTDA